MNSTQIRYRKSGIDERPVTLREAKRRDPKFDKAWAELEIDPLYIELLNRKKQSKQHATTQQKRI
jgi:hypothetical protein